MGGDYYDVISLEGTHWIIIGDVSGHGVTAGLVMMMAQTAIHAVLESHLHDPPVKVLELVNRTLYENIRKLGGSKYMTMTILSCQENGEFFFSGLHQDIIVYREGSGEVERVETNGMWIGVVEDINGMLELGQFSLNPGDAMLLFTDGITEAKNENKEMFSIDGLVKVLDECGQGPVDQIAGNILNAIDDYSGDDDITFMVVKRCGR